jgi:hypothetical protein
MPDGGRALDASWIPPRAASTPASLLALDAGYTNGPESVRNTFYSIQPSIRSMPAGVQRIGGVDFDIRGMAQIGISDMDVDIGQAPLQSEGMVTTLQCLPAGGQAAAAVHLLLRPSVRAPLPTGEPLAKLTLHYVDGGEAQLLVRAGVDVPGYGGQDEPVPQTYATFTTFPMFGLDPELLSTPRLANPEPARALRCLDFAATDLSGPVLLLGITLEPPAAAAGATAAPVAPARSPQ